MVGSRVGRMLSMGLGLVGVLILDPPPAAYRQSRRVGTVLSAAVGCQAVVPMLESPPPVDKCQGQTYAVC